MLDFAVILCRYISHTCLKLFILSSMCMKEQTGPTVFQHKWSQQNDPRMTSWGGGGGNLLNSMMLLIIVLLSIKNKEKKTNAEHLFEVRMKQADDGDTHLISVATILYIYFNPKALESIRSFVAISTITLEIIFCHHNRVVKPARQYSIVHQYKPFFIYITAFKFGDLFYFRNCKPSKSLLWQTKPETLKKMTVGWWV